MAKGDLTSSLMAHTYARYDAGASVARRSSTGKSRVGVLMTVGIFLALAAVVTFGMDGRHHLQSLAAAPAPAPAPAPAKAAAAPAPAKAAAAAPAPAKATAPAPAPAAPAPAKAAAAPTKVAVAPHPAEAKPEAKPEEGKKEGEEHKSEAEERWEYSLKKDFLVIFVVLIIMLSLTFELTVSFIKRKVAAIPGDGKNLLKMVESLFMELTILGFVGICMYLAQKFHLIQDVSKHYFHNGEELSEIFEKIHMMIFVVMVLFICLVMVLLRSAEGINKNWDDAERVTPEQVAAEYLKEQALLASEGRSWSAVQKWKHNHRLEDLRHQIEHHLMRNEFIYPRGSHEEALPPSFHFAEYLSKCLGDAFVEIVEIPVISWFWMALIFVTARLYFMLPYHIQRIVFTVLGYFLMCLLLWARRSLLAIRAQLTPDVDYYLAKLSEQQLSGGEVGALKLEDGQVHLSTPPPFRSNPLTEPWSPPFTIIFGEAIPSKHEALFTMAPLGDEFMQRFLQLVVVFQAISLAIVLSLFVYVQPWWETVLQLIPVTISLAFILPPTLSELVMVTSVEMLKKDELIEEVQEERELKKKALCRKLVTIFKLKGRAIEAKESGKARSLDLSTIDEEEKKNYTAVFEKYDDDGSGQLSHKEFSLALKSLGFDLPQSQVATMIASVDVNNDGELSLDEFLTVMLTKYSDDESRAHVKAAFRSWDTDNSGYLSSKELFDILVGEYHEDCTHAEVEDILLEVDADGSGRVDESELEALLFVKE